MYTPIGTRIESTFRDETFMTVQIFPSLRDVRKTRGLCGTLTDNCQDDFLKADGNNYTDDNTRKNCSHLGLSDYSFQPNEFSESWR